MEQYKYVFGKIFAKRNVTSKKNSFSPFAKQNFLTAFRCLYYQKATKHQKIFTIKLRFSENQSWIFETTSFGGSRHWENVFIRLKAKCVLLIILAIRNFGVAKSLYSWSLLLYLKLRIFFAGKYLGRERVEKVRYTWEYEIYYYKKWILQKTKRQYLEWKYSQKLNTNISL